MSKGVPNGWSSSIFKCHSLNLSYTQTCIHITHNIKKLTHKFYNHNLKYVCQDWQDSFSVCAHNTSFESTPYFGYIVLLLFFLQFTREREEPGKQRNLNQRQSEEGSHLCWIAQHTRPIPLCLLAQDIEEKIDLPYVLSYEPISSLLSLHSFIYMWEDNTQKLLCGSLICMSQRQSMRVVCPGRPFLSLSTPYSRM